MAETFVIASLKNRAFPHILQLFEIKCSFSPKESNIKPLNLNIGCPSFCNSKLTTDINANKIMVKSWLHNKHLNWFTSHSAQC